MTSLEDRLAEALRALFNSPREGQCGEEVRLRCGESKLDEARIVLWEYDQRRRDEHGQIHR